MIQESIFDSDRSRKWCEDKYTKALSEMKVTFPTQVCCDAFETGGCVHGKPCECGWKQAPWPWIVYRPGGPFCDCHFESRRDPGAWLQACASGACVATAQASCGPIAALTVGMGLDVCAGLCSPPASKKSTVNTELWWCEYVVSVHVSALYVDAQHWGSVWSDFV